MIATRSSTRPQIFAINGASVAFALLVLFLNCSTLTVSANKSLQHQQQQHIIQRQQQQQENTCSNQQQQPKTLKTSDCQINDDEQQQKPLLSYNAKQQQQQQQNYLYARQRDHSSNLRISERFKTHFLNDNKLSVKVNGSEHEFFSAQTQLPTYDELVFEAIHKMYQHKFAPIYLHKFDDVNDKRRAADQSLVNQAKCASHLSYLVEQLARARSNKHESLKPELSAFFDSYARQESGLLFGNTFWTGSYYECIERRIFDLSQATTSKVTHSTTNNKPIITINKQQSTTSSSSSSSNVADSVVDFSGRYCVASIKAPTWRKQIKRRLNEQSNYFNTQYQPRVYEQLFQLELGVCLPSSCDSTAIERHAEEIQYLTFANLDESKFGHYKLDDIYCLPDAKSELRSWTSNKSALTFVVCVGVWLLIVFVATAIDVLDSSDATTKSRWTLVFSLRANMQKLLKVSNNAQSEQKQQQKQTVEAATATTIPNSNNDNNSEIKTKQQQQQQQEQLTNTSNNYSTIDLRFLNAFKVLVMFWIVNGHVMLLMIQAAKNVLQSDGLLNIMFHFFIGATFGVDLFFTMTGFITSYMLFNSGYAFKMRAFHWLFASVQRYWRLAPLYLLTFWFSKSVAQLLGSGPLWDYGTSFATFRGLCNNQPWSYALTLTSNLHALFEECMITSWYISCDMQFWLASPILLHLLAKQPIAGWLATLSAIAACAKLRFDAISASSNTARYDELVYPRADIFMRYSHDMPKLYTFPQHRIGPYLIGLLAGHYVYMVASKKWKSPLVSLQTLNKTPATTIVKTAETSVVETTDNSEQLTKNTSLATTTTTTSGKQRVLFGIKFTSQLQYNLRQLLAFIGVFGVTCMGLSSFIMANFSPNFMIDNANIAATLAYSVCHMIMSFCFCLTVVCMCFGHWPRLTRFLSHKNWTRASKINYSLLLLQCEAIYMLMFRFDEVPLAGTKEAIAILLHLLVYLYPLALFTTLAFEFPLVSIGKILFKF